MDQFGNIRQLKSKKTPTTPIEISQLKPFLGKSGGSSLGAIVTCLTVGI